MKGRLPMVLSATALVVAVFGSTSARDTLLPRR